MSGFDHDVAIVGSGPAGLGAAAALARAGVRNIVVYERETAIGGIPRHTHHPTFGLLVFKRPVPGPKYIAALRRRCKGVRFETATTVTALGPGGWLDLATPAGMHRIRARHVILATGARETPRHPRLVSGLRPQGVTTTGALQQHVYGAGLRPFERPVIVGTELVSFSALWTLRHAGIRPVAMIEANARITAYRPAVLLAQALRVPIRTNSAVTDIGGIETVEQVTIAAPGRAPEPIACDGVIFSGRFTGENTLAGASHLEIDPGNRIPLVDQNRVTSDPAVSAIGNAVHPADMGDQCYLEGLEAGTHVAALLAGGAPAPAAGWVPIRRGLGIKMLTPSMLRPDSGGETRLDLHFHVTEAFRGTVEVRQGERIMYQKTLACLPARRIVLASFRVPLEVFQAALPITLALAGQN